MRSRKLRQALCICVCLVASGCDRGTSAEVELSQPQAPARSPRSGEGAVRASAPLDPATRARLESALGGFEHQPSAEDLYAIEGDGATLRALLIDLHEDTTVRRGVRQRALSALQHAPGEATNAYYEALLERETTRAADRRIAIRAYANAAGAEAEASLIEQLSQEDASARSLAAQALGELNLPGAIAALEERARVEQVAMVRARIGEALGRDIGPAPGQAGEVSQ